MKLEKLSFEVFGQSLNSLKSVFETVFWENHRFNHQLCTAKEIDCKRLSLPKIYYPDIINIMKNIRILVKNG